ncbi:DNA helicase, partial [human gut metagenome]
RSPALRNQLLHVDPAEFLRKDRGRTRNEGDRQNDFKNFFHYAEARREFLKRHRRISEFDSENLTYALLERVLEAEPAFRHLGVLCHQPLRQLIRAWTLLDNEERRYASNGATHLDFLIYNRVSKRPVLAVETDGYQFHKQGTRQSERDRMKDRILDRYGLPLLRLSTTGTDEELKIHTQLTELLQR